MTLNFNAVCEIRSEIRIYETIKRVTKVEAFSRRLALHSIAIPLDTFPLIDDILVDKVIFESIITPRNLIFSTFFQNYVVYSG